MKNMELNIDVLHHDDLDNPLHPSTFDHNEGYDILILRLPILKKLHEIEMISFGFIICETQSYVYDTTTERLEKLPERFENIYEMMDKKIDELLTFFKRYQDEILTIEELLYAEYIDTKFMSRWIRHKRDIVRIEHVMQLAADALKEFIKRYEHQNDFPVNHYDDLLEHCERIYRSASLQLAKLDYIYNFYTTRTAEKMNRIIFVLTLISGIFLPLNLFVGFFGMNTTDLPFTNEAMGTYNVILFLIGTAIFATGLSFFLQKKTKVNK
ncbi:MAG: magnesium transporter CorA family protein [Sulfurovum sp.]